MARSREACLNYKVMDRWISLRGIRGKDGMRAALFLLCISIILGGAGANAADGGGKYGADGPLAVRIETLSAPSPYGAFAATAFIPAGRGPFPVVILSSGFMQKGAAYAPYARRLASWGIIALLRDDPTLLSDLGQAAGLGEGHRSIIRTPAPTRDVNAAGLTNRLASDLLYEVEWLAGPARTDPASPLYRKIDRNRIGLAGHSYGGQASLLAAARLRGRIKGVFGIDPVDPPLGSQARDTLTKIGAPVVLLGETENAWLLSCAPSWFNYQMLYRYAPSGATMITAAGADHTMFEDPANCSFCFLCLPGTADASEVLRYSVRYLAAFFARELLADRSVGARFEGAGAAEDVKTGRIEMSVK
jgi:dienelactone hydrolase